MAAITTIAMVTWRYGGSGEDRPSEVTSARERASSGKSQGVRGSPPRLALWTLHSQANTTARHHCDPVGVTLNLCLNLLTAGHSCSWPARVGQGTGSAGGGRWDRDDWEMSGERRWREGKWRVKAGKWRYEWEVKSEGWVWREAKSKLTFLKGRCTQITKKHIFSVTFSCICLYR